MKHLERLEANGPDLEEVAGYPQRKNLLAWGFPEPFTGTFCEKIGEISVFCWAGEFTDKNEAPVLVTAKPKGWELSQSDWFTGVVFLDQVEAVDDPRGLIVASATSRAASTTPIGRFSAAIDYLELMIPLRTGSYSRS